MIGDPSSPKTIVHVTSQSDRFLVHRLLGHPWRTCGGRLGRSGKFENCPFVYAPNYQHAFAAVETPAPSEENPLLRTPTDGDPGGNWL